MSSDLSDWLVNGPRLNWTNLAKFVGGTLVVTGSLGVSRIVGGITAAGELLLGGLAGFMAEYVMTLLGWPAKVGIAAWRAATEFVTSFGVLAPFIALSIGLVVLYVYQEAIQQ